MNQRVGALAAGLPTSFVHPNPAHPFSALKPLMRKAHLSLTLTILIFMAVLCVAASASATGQKRRTRGRTARPQSTPAASDSSTTLVKLRQELERREAAGELTEGEAETTITLPRKFK